MIADGTDGLRTTVIKHKTLSTYYARITTLEGYFGVPPTRAGDSGEYAAFIRDTICASHDRSGAKNVPGISAEPLECALTSHRDCVDWIIADLKGRGKNVLIKPDAHGTYANEESNLGRDPETSLLYGSEWRTLHSRIGDQAFRHIIVHTSMYKPVGNNTYLQLSGLPLCDLYEGRKKCGMKRKRVREEPGRKKRKISEDSTATSSKGRDTGPADVYISRQRMFYGQGARTRTGRFVAGLHPQHMLNQLKADKDPNHEAEFSLMCAMFAKPPGAGTIFDIKNDRRRAQILDTARSIITQHAAIEYDRLLKMCVHRAGDHTRDGLQPLSHSQVCRFVIATLKTLLSTSVGERSLTSICRHARRLITVKQFEPINLHSILEDVKVADFRWVQVLGVRPNQAESRLQKILVERFLHWLFEEYLVPLIKNTFYVTETAATKYQTVYYPHEAWTAASQPHFAKLRSETLVPLTQVQETMALQGPLGVSAVRLIPKPNGFRPIVNLGRRIGGKKGQGVTSRSVPKSSTANHLLRGIHQVLSYEKERNRDMLGSSLFGTNEIFAPLHGIKNDLIQRHGKVPRLFFVKMDIKAAFDTIKQDKALRVIENLLDSDYDYVLMMYSLLLPPASEASQRSARRLFKTRAVIDDGHPNFSDLASTIAKPLRNAVIVDLQRSKRVTTRECMALLHQHIKENTWQIGSRLYRQKEGIPQGSMISSLLCSLFYAALEREHLGFVNKPGSRLLRYIDDFLYITDDLASARRFISVMTTGFPEYGAFISPEKTLRSFEYAKGDQVGAVCPLHRDGTTYFPFCGFWINAETLEMTIDIPRITAGEIKQSFALRFARHRGKAFVGWLSRQLENRNHVAYLDTVHNSVATVHLNIFLNFATTAMKIPHYFAKGKNISPGHARLIFGWICLSIHYTYVAGRARLRHAARDASHPDSHYRVRQVDFEFLAKSAISLVLNRKVGRFKDIIHLLRCDLEGSNYRSMRGRHEALILRGWAEVTHAKY